MRFPTSLPSVVLLVIGAAFFGAGCSKEPSEQQKQADAVLVRAKAILARGDYGEARRLLGTALTLDESLGRTSRQAEELRLLGGLMTSVASFDSAVNFYNRAVEQYRNLADRSSVRDVTLDVAGVYRLMGQERKAYLLYVEALRLARVFNEADGVRDIQWAMLPSCRALAETDDERRILSSLQQHAVATRDVREQGRVRVEAALGALSRDAFDTAETDLRRAATLYDAARDSLQSLATLVRLGGAYDAAGNSRESLQTYGEAIRRSDNVRGAGELRLPLFTRVGNTYLRARRSSEAVRFYRAALVTAVNTGNKVAEGYIAIQLAHCDLESNRDAAVKAYLSALDLFRSIGYGPGIAYAEACVGSALQRGGQFTEAYKHLKASIERSAALVAPPDGDSMYGDCERSFPGAGSAPAYDAMIELLLQAGKYDEAFDVVEQRTSRALHARLLACDPRPADEALAGALQRYQEEVAQQTGAERLYTRLFPAGVQQREQVASVRKALDAGVPRVADAADAVARINRAYEPVVRLSGARLAAAQRALAPGVALVEYVPTRRSLYLFVVTASNVSVQLAAVYGDSAVSYSRQLLMAMHQRELRLDTTQFALLRLDGQIQNLSTSLYGAFIRPIEPVLAGITKLIVICTGDLPPVPIHILRKSPYGGNPFVAEHHLVTNLPSVQSLFLSSQSLATVQRVIGVGHPGATDWDVEYELRDIRAFYKDATLFFGQQASLSTLQTESADLLHLAIDLRYNDRAPEDSWIVLSDGKSTTGDLHVPLGELFSLAPYPTIVLSSLSADSWFTPPVVPYILLANRTAAVLTAPYAPSRKTKKTFGETFYTALLQGGTTPSAYWRSQLEMMKNPESSSPAAWGAFALWGK